MRSGSCLWRRRFMQIVNQVPFHYYWLYLAWDGISSRASELRRITSNLLGWNSTCALRDGTRFGAGRRGCSGRPIGLPEEPAAGARVPERILRRAVDRIGVVEIKSGKLRRRTLCMCRTGRLIYARHFVERCERTTTRSTPRRARAISRKRVIKKPPPA